jgi:hypothetical protein
MRLLEVPKVGRVQADRQVQAGRLEPPRNELATGRMVLQAVLLTVLLTALLIALLASVALAADQPPFSARQGVDLAWEAAKVWAADAELVYVENDEPLEADGTASRWGYLFHSSASGQSRGYSLRAGQVLEAADLDFEFSAPPLPADWLDSGAILAEAQQNAGQAYCRDFQGQLSTMFLIRGAFHEKDPDRSTWAVIYTSPTEPNLLVVVDARAGKIVRKWKG